MRSQKNVRHEIGFTLIEVVVSIALIGVLVFIFATLAQTTLINRDAKDEDIALRIASSELDTLRAGGYGNLPASGPFADILMTSLPGGAGTITVSSYNASTKEVQVSVTWKNAALPESVSLTTLITQTGGLTI